MIKGIDVSKWQGVINWAKVAADGVQFAILKAGGSDCGFYTDKNFLINAIGAASNCIHIGAYYFVGKNCTSAREGQANALRFMTSSRM
jgi:GH25 family lysozyme M1 (1,4-beta-N-acetylmuramidase)